MVILDWPWPIFCQGQIWPLGLLNGKKLEKSSSSEPLGWLPWNLVCSIKWPSCTKFVQMVTLGWPSTFFRQGQIWSLGILNGKKVKHCIFQMNGTLCECQKSRSFKDLGLRSLGLNVCQHFQTCETAGPISTKSHMQHPENMRIWDLFKSSWSLDQHGPYAHIMVKTLKHLLQNRWADWLETWYVASVVKVKFGQVGYWKGKSWYIAFFQNNGTLWYKSRYYSWTSVNAKGQGDSMTLA